MEKLYTVEEVAKQLSVTGRTIRNYLKSGRLVGRKIGGQWRFPESEVQRLLNGSEPELPEGQVAQPAPQPAMAETTATETFSLYRENEQDFADAAEDNASTVTLNEYEGPAYQDFPAPAPLPSVAPPPSVTENSDSSVGQDKAASFNPFSAQPKPDSSQPPLAENVQRYVQPVIPPVQKPNILPIQQQKPEAIIPPVESTRPAPEASYGNVIAPSTQNVAPLPEETAPRYAPPVANEPPAAPTAAPPHPIAEPPAPQVQQQPAVTPQPQQAAEAAQPIPSYVRENEILSPAYTQAPPPASPAQEYQTQNSPVSASYAQPVAQNQAPSQVSNTQFLPDNTQTSEPVMQQSPPPADVQPVQSTKHDQTPVQPAPLIQETVSSPSTPFQNNYQPAAYPYQPVPGYYYPYSTQNGYPIQAPWYPGIAPTMFTAPVVSTDATTPGQDSKMVESSQDVSASDVKSDDSSGNSPELSDVGKQVLKFISEVHDCSQGPCVCSVFDLYQSLNVAKSTSERLAAIAEQESANGVLCQAYVEFDDRYLLARYTLLGTSAFLSRCMQILG